MRTARGDARFKMSADAVALSDITSADWSLALDPPIGQKGPLRDPVIDDIDIGRAAYCFSS